VRNTRRLCASAWLAAAAVLAFCGVVEAETLDCSQFHIKPTDSQPLQGSGDMPDSCKTRMKNGFPIPDPACTPGAINRTLTTKVLRNPDFRTSCVRDNTTTAAEKASTYKLYSIPHPANNKGAMQTCELDHLISLELGGADTLDNIWPQCGPGGVALIHRYFKEKDIVENYLAKRVRDGVMDLADAQKGIATDWTQYLEDAKKACTSAECRDSDESD
jgi:hypothetical protein